MTTDYEQTYVTFWKRIVEHPDGTLNRDQVMLELHDYADMMGEVAKVYEELAGLSKPNTAAVHIIQGADDKYQAMYADYLCERAQELFEYGDTASGAAMKQLAEEWHEGSWAAYTEGREQVAQLRARVAGR